VRAEKQAQVSAQLSAGQPSNGYNDEKSSSARSARDLPASSSLNNSGSVSLPATARGIPSVSNICSFHSV
jgi:hypothetical protein